MNIEKTKIIRIDEHDYQIGLFPAVIGNWIVAQIQARTGAGEETFSTIQAHCLNVCFRIKVVPGTGETMPVKVFDKALDRILIPDLADDLWTINQLYDAVLDFNLTPFFKKLKALKKQETPEASDIPLPGSLPA